ncbi:MAG: hypothetical protein LBO75_03535 [Bifidobacteriaceae bacterium]|nr:hypothetical protein [Bifidobacteriaceae bacterium]
MITETGEGEAKVEIMVYPAVGTDVPGFDRSGSDIPTDLPDSELMKVSELDQMLTESQLTVHPS